MTDRRRLVLWLTARQFEAVRKAIVDRELDIAHLDDADEEEQDERRSLITARKALSKAWGA